MKARIPKHREFVINLEKTAEEKRNSNNDLFQHFLLRHHSLFWHTPILEDYKKDGKSVYTPSFIEDNEDKVKALQAEYGFEYTIELK